MLAPLVPLLLAAGLTGDFAKSVRLAFRPSKSPAAVFKPRAKTLANAPAMLDQADVEALVAAYEQLEKELVPLESRHREFVLRGHRDKSREPRPDVDGLRELEERILEQIAAVRDPELVSKLVDGAVRRSSSPLALRLTLADLARELPGTDPENLLKRAAKASAPEDELVALTIAAALGPDARRLVPLALEALESEHVVLQEAGVDALVGMRAPEALVPLVRLLEQGDRRTGDRAVTALQVLTGQRISRSSDAWRRWLADEGAPYLSGDRTLGHGDPVVANAKAKAMYHGLPLDGESIVFVLDVSQSMSKTLARQGAQDDETRIERAKSELIRALGQLSPETRFHVIAFGGTIEHFVSDAAPKARRTTSARPGSSTRGGVAEAQEWVRELKLNLGTRIHDALDVAFALADHRPGAGFYDAGVDAVYLLTDGRPIVAGKNDDVRAILRSVRRLNLRRRVVVYTIGLGNDVPKKLLKTLAAEHGGEFVHERDGG